MGGIKKKYNNCVAPFLLHAQQQGNRRMVTHTFLVGVDFCPYDNVYNSRCKGRRNHEHVESPASILLSQLLNAMP